MIITRLLAEACPYCGTAGDYGNVNVGSNCLTRGCRACGEFLQIPLPKITKQTLYLDQFFFSNAFKERDARFVTTAATISRLVSEQLVVCPWSDVHELETNLWSNERRQDLWKFIKQSSRGRRFHRSMRVESAQLQRAFVKFCAGEPATSEIHRSDGFGSTNIHDWDDYFWIDVPMEHLLQTDDERSAKAATVSSLVDLFPMWRQQTLTYAQDVSQEVGGYGQKILDHYRAWVKAFVSGAAGALPSSWEADLAATLMTYDQNGLDYEPRLHRLAQFLQSEHFAATPCIDISCQMFAALRKLVRSGAHPNPQTARERLAGFYFDVNFISHYGPYCDLMFVDNAKISSVNRATKATEACSSSPFSRQPVRAS